MRPLIIDDEARAKVQRVRGFAEQPANYYIVGKDGFSFQKPPGDDPRHVAWIPVGFKCVFSFTLATVENKIYRHLSVSVPAMKKYPNVFAMYTIAELFGFTGWDGKTTVLPGDWLGNVNKEEHCVALAQPI